ncbi:hypothetical protein [Pararobbsia alpina]|uniref:Uncharacterized protein n=1 Tax=Pararobbsia alpina TaxID=621374 RepID=A0A6S7DE46_9BURK|nr:hypothetical protein [Pararobbsia alpina]CAB3802947.1 hypothetical protein LMG28138_05270 [Pararobbsia alpina]
MDGLPRIACHAERQEVWAVSREPEEKEQHGRPSGLVTVPHRPCPLNLRFRSILDAAQRAELIGTQQERERVAQLNLMAGKRAKAATACDAALQYFTTGRALLAKTGWEQCYQTAFDLELNRAECEYLIGKVAAAEERLATLSIRAQTTVDAAAVTCVRINLYPTLSRSASAVEVGLEYLRRVGDQWSPHPTEQDVRQAYQRLRQLVGAGSSEGLLDLPLMSDPTRCATMDVLTVLTSPALLTDLNLFRLVVSQMATLSLEHGNCNGSCLAYAWLGGVLGTYFGEYRVGFDFGRLGLDLVERYGLDRFRARVYLVFAVHVAQWTQPLEMSLAFLRRAFNAALEAGDLSYAAYSCIDVITNHFATGDSLGDVEREAEHGLEFARSLRFPQVSDTIIGQMRFVRMLRGLTPEFNSFNDAEFDEHSFQQHLESDPQLAIGASFYWIRKLQASVLANDSASAIAAVSKVAWGARAGGALRLHVGRGAPPPFASLSRASLTARGVGRALSHNFREPRGVGRRRDRTPRWSGPGRDAPF